MWARIRLTLSIALRTRSEVIKPFSTRFAISVASEVPEDRHAICNGTSGTCIAVKTALRAECRMDPDTDEEKIKW